MMKFQTRHIQPCSTAETLSHLESVYFIREALNRVIDEVNKQGVALEMAVTEKEISKIVGDALNTIDLSSIIDTALQQAIASGDLKGEPGTPVTIVTVAETTTDGGYNEVTFSDGTVLKVKNGNTGNPYTLTKGDKDEIVNATIEALPKYTGGVV